MTDASSASEPEPVGEEPRPAPGAAKEPVAAPARLRLPGAFYFLILLQTAATAMVAFALLGGSLDLLSRWTGPQTKSPALRSPSLDLPRDHTVHGPTGGVAGYAPESDFVALLVDGRVIALELVHDGRFRFSGLEIGPGDYRLSVIAYRRGGQAIESPSVRLRIERAPTAPPPDRTPTPKPSAPPAAGATTTPAAKPARSTKRRSRNIQRGPTRRHIALTFDGGSTANQARTVLDALHAKGVRSTIFLTGEFIELYPDVTRRIVADGHEVGNHTWDHPHLANWVTGHGHDTREGVTAAFLRGQLRATERIFEETTKTTMTRYWRAPYGEINPEILSWAGADGWVHIGWTQGLDTLDWVADPSDRLYRSADQIRDRLLTQARSGERTRGGIVLMHLGADRESDLPHDHLPEIIDGLRSEGYELVTVSQLLG